MELFFYQFFKAYIAVSHFHRLLSLVLRTILNIAIIQYSAHLFNTSIITSHRNDNIAGDTFTL